MTTHHPTPTLCAKQPTLTVETDRALPTHPTDVIVPQAHPPRALNMSALAKIGTAGQLPELMTLEEVCIFLRVKKSYIYSLTATDRIPNRKFAGTLRFVKTELLQWLERGRRGPR